MQTSYVGGQPVEFGDLKVAVLLGTNGPTSYAIATGDPVSNPAYKNYIAVPFSATTVSRNYTIRFSPNAVGDIEDGAASGSISGWVAFWTNSGNQGVLTVVQNAAGTGMTPGTTVPIVFSGGGGSGAAGTVTVLTATTISISLTATGAGYTTAPSATISGTGGTPATLTATAGAASGPVTAGTNLSAEVLQFGAFITER